jgi:hypothetical protein
MSEERMREQGDTRKKNRVPRTEVATSLGRLRLARQSKIARLRAIVRKQSPAVPPI